MERFILRVFADRISAFFVLLSFRMFTFERIRDERFVKVDCFAPLSRYTEYVKFVHIMTLKNKFILFPFCVCEDNLKCVLRSKACAQKKGFVFRKKDVVCACVPMPKIRFQQTQKLEAFGFGGKSFQ